MRKTITQLHRLLGRMQQFAKNRVVSGKKFGAFQESALEHGRPPSPVRNVANRHLQTPGAVTLAWRERSNQADFLLPLRLLRGHIRESIQRIQVGPSRSHDDIRIGSMT